jgi:raffinose/stachyose/melibiose transport system permease protein
MVILLAGLQAIDHQIQEAARVDGANRVQRFRYITLPLLRPAFTVSVVLTTVTGMLLFDAVVATTDGGPGYSTETLATQLYKQAFLFNNFGFGMAMGVLMSVLILVATGLLMWMLNRRDLAT